MKARRSVVTYLLAAFLVTLGALGALVTVTTRDGFQREREAVAERMRSVSRSTADSLASNDAATGGFLATMAKELGAIPVDPTTCAAALGSLSALASEGRIGVLRADGSIVCAVGNSDLSMNPTPVPGRAPTQALRRGPERDRASGLIIETLAVPVGSSGALLVAVFPSGVWETIDVSALPPEALVLVLDAERDDVAGASAGGKHLVGAHFEGTELNRPIPSKGVVSDAIDGRDRMYIEVVDEDAARHVLVGLPPAVALASAQRQLERSLTFGVIAVTLVGGLGLLLHNRITGPVGRLTRRIREVGEGSDAWAPVEGPAELAELAEAFNEMLSNRRAHEADLRHQAAHDGLTGLPNRARLTEELGTAVLTGRPPAVMFLDLDRFKYVNDSHGHSVGDRLLVALAGRLRKAVRSDCMVARFGGDEFVILAPCTERQAIGVAERVLQSVSDPFEIEGNRLYVTGSVGIVIAQTGDTAEDLIRYADTAMYRAKDSGRAGYAVFDEQLREQSAALLRIERDLHLALDRGEFALHFQPKFAIGTGQLAGLEALLRWTHPERGMVSPAEFIPIAQETGIIEPLGSWVLETACEQAAAWRRQGYAPIPVAVNIAPRQLARPDFSSFVAGVLARTGMDAADLTLEITESAVLEDPLGAADQLRRLRSLGVRLSLDDFGTGYSSLSHLQHFPVDEVKIDRSFVSMLAGEGPSRAIVGSIIQLSHAIGLSVVAEGVETDEQRRLLVGLGCEMAQGFLMGRPVAPEGIEPLLAAVDPTFAVPQDALGEDPLPGSLGAS